MSNKEIKTTINIPVDVMIGYNEEGNLVIEIDNVQVQDSARNFIIKALDEFNKPKNQINPLGYRTPDPINTHRVISETDEKLLCDY